MDPVKVIPELLKNHQELSNQDLFWMRRCLQVAELALPGGDVPIGAVVVGLQQQELSIGWNTRQARMDPCGHAEIHALQAAASQLGDWRLEGCTLYVNLEPCAMCAGALLQSRIARCVWAAPDPKAGWLGSLGNLAQDSRLNHRFAVQGGVLAEESAALIRSFFKRLRAQKRQLLTEAAQSSSIVDSD